LKLSGRVAYDALHDLKEFIMTDAKQWRTLDPFFAREQQKYGDNPLPSREFILNWLEAQGKLLTFAQIARAFDMDAAESEKLQFRLKAMLGAGQLMCNRQGRFGVARKMDLISGFVVAHQEGYGFFSPENGEADGFIPPKYMAELMHGDKILARVKDTDERGRKDYAPVEILERAQKRIVGKLAVQQGVWSLLPDNRRLTHHLIIPADALGGGKARAGLAGRDYLVNLGRAGVKAAVKTGTSNSEINGKVSAKDIWAAGYTPNLSMAVWLGNSDTSPLRNGNSLIPAMFFDRTMADISKMYADQGKLKLSDWYTAPSGIQTIKGEIYPSYYNKASAATNAKMTFDRVSKKKATSCTPEAAKIEIDVMKMADPITRKEIVTPNDSSYDAEKDDDAHKCDDPKPNVTLTVTSGGVSIVYTSGRYKLQNIELLSGSTVVASKQVDSSGIWNIHKGNLSAASSGTLTAKITDTGYYTATSSASYNPNSSSDDDD